MNEQEKLAAKGIGTLVGVMALKWVVIVTMARAFKRAADRAGAS